MKGKIRYYNNLTHKMSEVNTLVEKSEMLDFLTNAKEGTKFNIVLFMFSTGERKMGVDLPPMVELEVISPFPTFETKVVSKNCCVSDNFITNTLKDFPKNLESDYYWGLFNICPENIHLFSGQETFFESELERHIQDYREAKMILEIAEEFFRSNDIYFEYR